MSMATLYERVGGETALRAIIDDFVERVYADMMIGFFFARVNKARLKELEYQLAAAFLGGPVKYRGRPLDQAHGPHPIMGGQFARRKQLLKETLEAHQAPAAVVNAWLEHTEGLRPLITQDAGSDCDPAAARAKVEALTGR